ncbi:MAG: futalosine hydrolase [Thermodesulfobacteriota bacterium]|nr:futalosine hydrolase [Thermodesulfobacteriota bacterium]
MFLVVCATEFELQPLLERVNPEKKGWMSLVTGVGMVETTLNLTRLLEQQPKKIHAVLNFGVAGAYKCDGREGAGLLEICLAEQEVFGDFGICHVDRIEPLAEHLVHRPSYVLDHDLLNRAETLLQENGLSAKRGNFVTVCGVSATERRGTMLGTQYDGLSENMEGAAVARVCEEFNLPLLEMRTISNFVEERDIQRWKLTEACAQAGKAAAILLKGLT